MEYYWEYIQMIKIEKYAQFHCINAPLFHDAIIFSSI